jgi:hypothetical protein
MAAVRSKYAPEGTRPQFFEFRSSAGKLAHYPGVGGYVVLTDGRGGCQTVVGTTEGKTLERGFLCAVGSPYNNRTINVQ